MPDLPAGTVTFLFTDIEGSTRRWQQDATAMQSAAARHDDLLQEAVAHHHGVLYKHVGDAAQAAFASPHAALLAAVAAQQGLRAAAWDGTERLLVRMALHAGEATPTATGDYHQVPSLNRLARLLSAGHGGQILVSDTIRRLVADKLPAEITLRDLGEHRLRDLLEPERIWQVIAPGLESDFPALKTLDSRPNNLSRQPTPFLGREQLVADLKALLRREDVQLVTLTGPGGVGKTRLALQAAADVLDAFPDGVYFVDLAPLTDPALVLATIAGSIGVRSEGPGATSDALAAFLRDKHLLLLLDNFEHLLTGAPAVGELLRACPRLTVLATSRAPVRLRAEREVPVPPLALPDPARHEPPEQLTQYEAVRLFIERAVAATPAFTVDNDNAPAVAEICARLDGLPLAIELAAARVRMLPPQALLRRLEHRLPLLTSGARDAPQRQRTLRDAIAWSHDLLATDERTLFRRLGVFAGGCTLEMAEAVANPDSDLDLFAGLAALHEEGLLRQEAGAGGEPRFRMLETIREFALEQLAGSGEEPEVRTRLAGWFVDQAEAIVAAFDVRYPVELIERLEADYPNITASLEWLERTGQGEALLRLAGAVWEFWYLTGRFGEGRAWLDRALNSAPPTPSPGRVWALRAVGDLLHQFGDDDGAIARLTEAAALARHLGLPGQEAAAVFLIGVVAEDRGDYDAAESHFLAALELFRRVDDSVGPTLAAYHFGVIAYGRGETDRAKRLWKEALTAARARDEVVVADWCFQYLALLAAEQGQLSEAAATLRAAFALGLASAHGVVQGEFLDTVAVLGCACGRYAVAARLQGAASILEAHSGRFHLPERLVYQRTDGQLRAALGEEGYTRARQEGAAFRPEDVTAAVETILAVAATPG